MLQLSAACGATSRVSPYGATVVSWVPWPGAPDALFTSKLAVWDGTKPIRGGVPVVFPVFGSGDGALPSHGFARVSTWKLDASTPSSATFSLTPGDVDAKLVAAWPHAFRLEYAVSLSDETGALTTELRIANVGDAPFEFQALLHTYYAVPDVAKLAVLGLAGREFVDQLDKELEVRCAADREPAFSIDREVDWIFLAPETGAAGVTVAYDGAAEGAAGGDVSKRAKALTGVHLQTALKVDARERRPDVVVWNPWIDKSKRMADFGDDEFRTMVCVEPGNVRGREVLAPKQVAVLRQVLTPRM